MQKKKKKKKLSQKSAVVLQKTDIFNVVFLRFQEKL